MEPIKVLGEPALLLSDGTLVVADLHLGFENELRSKGINIPLKVDELSARMENLIRSTASKRLVILGDIKHHVAGPEKLEFLVVPEFFSAIRGELSELHVVLGNHDGDLEALLPRNVIIHGSAGFAWRENWLTHGSTKLPKEAISSRRIIMGHVHPSVRIRDTIGYRYSFQVWLSGPMKGGKGRAIIVMPSFNKYVGQLAMNEPTRATLRGPLLSKKEVDLESLEVQTLDGHALGRLGDLT
jgi:putative SbcD/Mre11-related phosphoesterase